MENYDEKSRLLSTSRSHRTRDSRSCCATCCSSFSVVLYLAILLFSLFYFGYFLHLDILIDATERYSGQCVLFAKSPGSENDFTLNKNFTCELSVFWSCGLILLEVILLVMLIFNSVWGRWVKFLKIFELFVLGVCAASSLAISIILSLGYSLTCDTQKRFEEPSNIRCMELKLPETDIDYGYRMQIIQVVSWLVTAMLIFGFLLQLPISLYLCCKKRSHDHTLR